MSQPTTSTPTSKPGRAPRQRKPVERFLRLLVPPSDSGPAVLRLLIGGESFIYHVTEIGSDLGGRGFSVSKVDELTQQHTETYHVHLHGDTGTCDCPGCCRWSKCKHRDSLLKLVSLGSI